MIATVRVSATEFVQALFSTRDIVCDWEALLMWS